MPPNDRKVSQEHLPRELTRKKSSRPRNISAGERQSSRNIREQDEEDEADYVIEQKQTIDGRGEYGRNYESPAQDYAQYPGYA